MNQHSALDKLLLQLQAFKKKFYLNLLLRGSIFTAGLLLSVYIIYILLEYVFYFPNYVRAFLFFSFVAFVLYAFTRWIILPVRALTNLSQALSDEQAAARVGGHYPEIRDKLLNAIQLKNFDRTNDLIAASIEQRSGQLLHFRFSDAVAYRENKPLLKYFAFPAVVALLIALVYPTIFVQGTERIINYKTYYAPTPPFAFILPDDKLQTFKGEDYTLKVNLEGKAIPSEVYINYNGRRQKLTKQGNSYTYTFKQPQESVDFQLEGSGFFSDAYSLELLSRPNLKDFEMQVQFPAYLNRKPETIQNTGSATIPEGSTVTWQFITSETESIKLAFDEPAQTILATKDENDFSVSKKISQSQNYSIQLQNKYSANKDQINYQLTTIPDRLPQITLEQFQDTALYSFTVLGGNVSDDYGLSRLALHYRISNDKKPATAFKAINFPIARQQASQTYYHQWNTAAYNLQPGDKLEYFMQVWDNDGIRGPKSARTSTFELKVPDKQDLQKELNSNAQSIASQLSKSIQKSSKLNEELAKSEDKMKTKRELTWQDKKQLEEMVQKKKQLEQDIEAMKEMYNELNKKQNMLSEQDKQLAEKAQQLQKLMNDILDPETKKLYEELEKLLQEKQQNDPELQQLLSKLDNKERNMERELERALELFKQLHFEQKLDNIANQLEQAAKEQQQLADKTAQKQENNAALTEEQKQLNKDFDALKEEMDQLKDLNEKLENPNQLDEQQQAQKSIEQQMQQSMEQLQKQQNQKASESQQKASQQMKQLAKKMEEMQSSMGMESMQLNLDNLRDILENLIKLSFDQEKLMKDFRSVNQSDPRFISLSQQQLNLRDNAKVIEDSLVALSTKVFQIQAFVTREVAEMNQRMDNSMQAIRDRQTRKATGQQQLAMTSMNNLALMLNDVLKQMQEAMQKMQQGSMAGKQKGNKPKPGNMGQMQDALNKKIEELQKGGKSGKALSQELAKLAAEQEALRNALKEMSKQQGQKPGETGGNGQLGNISRMMEQTETDLVNKRLTEQTIMRQREILTRLLEAERSMKERELDNKREAKTAQDIARKVPPAFDKYIKAKQKQTDILKTVPPSLTPYYKQKVNAYFQNSSNNN